MDKRNVTIPYCPKYHHLFTIYAVDFKNLMRVSQLQVPSFLRFGLWLRTKIFSSVQITCCTKSSGCCRSQLQMILLCSLWSSVRGKATRRNYWRMQDGAPPHCTNAAKKFLLEKFIGRVISRWTSGVPWAGKKCNSTCTVSNQGILRNSSSAWRSSLLPMEVQPSGASPRMLWREPDRVSTQMVVIFNTLFNRL